MELLLWFHFSFSEYDLTCRNTEYLTGRLRSAAGWWYRLSSSSPGQAPCGAPRRRRDGRAQLHHGPAAAPELPPAHRPVPPGQRPHRAGRRKGPRRGHFSQRPHRPRAGPRSGTGPRGAGLSGGGRRENYPFALFPGLPDRQHLPRPRTPVARLCPDGSARRSAHPERSARTFIARGGGGPQWAALRATPPADPAAGPAGRPGTARGCPAPCCRRPRLAQGREAPGWLPRAAPSTKGRAGTLLPEGWPRQRRRRQRQRRQGSPSGEARRRRERREAVALHPR